MSDQNEAAESFNEELARRSTTQRRVNEILKGLPVQPQADVSRDTIVNHIIEKISETTEFPYQIAVGWLAKRNPENR